MSVLEGGVMEEWMYVALAVLVNTTHILYLGHRMERRFDELT